MQLKPARQIIGMVLCLLAFGLAAIALPDNPYQKWQLLDGTIHSRAKWIYERIHFDPTPIDVVFVGPSRVSQGVDAPGIGAALAKQGLPDHVVNFALPEEGRDINYTIVKELFTVKQPKLLVIGIIEKPSRFGHPAFKYIADRSDVVDPGYFVNLDYFGNLIYLPFRQMTLFAARLWPPVFDLAARFDPRSYLGSSIDTTGSIVLPDGTTKEGERPASLAELTRGVKKLQGGTHPPLLPNQLRGVEFGDERYNLKKIVDLAATNHTAIAFVFIPYYTDKDPIQEQEFYDRFGATWNARFLESHAEWYADYGHLTRTGAHQLSDWLVRPIAGLLGHAGSNSH